jgi:membrane protease YdiL (CAAX protease family)
MMYMMATMHGRHGGLLPNQWTWPTAALFATAVCAFGSLVSILGSFGPQVDFAISSIHFAVGSPFVFIMVAALVPAIVCFVLCASARESLRKVNAPWSVYLVAIGLGFTLPFMSYFGSHYASFPWSYTSRTTLARVFIMNLFLSPLWEEIIWRGCFLGKLRSFVSGPNAIAISSVAWTFWHGGYLAFLYSRGIPIRVLLVLPFTYFCVGIILGSMFEMGGRSLWPCVLMHAALNASTAVYYTTYDRASELSSYVAELFAVIVVAGLLYRFTTKTKPAGRVPDADVSTAWP